MANLGQSSWRIWRLHLRYGREHVRAVYHRELVLLAIQSDLDEQLAEVGRVLQPGRWAETVAWATGATVT